MSKEEAEILKCLPNSKDTAMFKLCISDVELDRLWKHISEQNPELLNIIKITNEENRILVYELCAEPYVKDVIEPVKFESLSNKKQVSILEAFKAGILVKFSQNN